MSDRTTDSGSYLFLGEEFTEAGDRFTRFWNNVEARLDDLTQPVAFAALPLNGTVAAIEPEESPAAVRHSRAPSSVSNGKSQARESPEPKVIDLEFDEDSDEDYYLIPSSKPASKQGTVVLQPSPSEVKLKDENEKLRAELEQARVRANKAEGLLKVKANQELQLRDSIMLVKREAQRNLLQSTTFRHPAITPIQPPLPALPSPTDTASSTPVATLQKRLREVEEENKRLKAENTKLNAQNSRYKEKWASLKESAKKRKSMRDAQGPTDGVKGMVIKEEDEEELAHSGRDRSVPPTPTTATHP